MFQLPISDELELVLLQPFHAQDLYDLTEKNRDHLREWLPWVNQTKSVEDTKNFIHSSLKDFAENQCFSSGIFYKRRIIGSIGLHEINWNNRSSSIGYWISEEFQGNGFITQACLRVLQYAFNTLSLNKISIQARIDNTKSKAVPERLGFQLEGILREQACNNNKFYDHALYSLLAAEWNHININN